jgi:hypothetical protein
MVQLKELRDYLKAKRPEMSFGIECVSPFTAPYVDYCHSFPGWNKAVNDWEGKGEKPKLDTFVELFRYSFPELLVSDRDIYDDQDVERRVNLALLRGLVSDVCVHRCRALPEDTPRYKDYLTKANAFRERHRRFIVNGLFRDTDGVSCENPELSYAVFETYGGGERAIVATQSHLAVAKAKFSAPGWKFRSCDGLGPFKASGEGNRAKAELGRHGLCILIFEIDP